MNINLFEAIGLTLEDVTYSLGAIIYPKDLLKIYNDNMAQRLKIVKLYHYLYKFSLERL